jgi:hypothetical protein
VSGHASLRRHGTYDGRISDGEVPVGGYGLLVLYEYGFASIGGRLSYGVIVFTAEAMI